MNKQTELDLNRIMAAWAWKTPAITMLIAATIFRLCIPATQLSESADDETIHRFAVKKTTCSTMTEFKNLWTWAKYDKICITIDCYLLSTRGVIDVWLCDIYERWRMLHSFFFLWRIGSHTAGSDRFTQFIAAFFSIEHFARTMEMVSWIQIARIGHNVPKSVTNWNANDSLHHWTTIFRI